MNLASWIILAIVVIVVGLAVKATFFKKKRGGCCDAGDTYRIETAGICTGDDYQMKMASGACGTCTACADKATARNAVQPIIKPAR